MASLFDLLDLVFSGIPSNAAYDLIKVAWKKATGKTWNDLYLDSFQAALSKMSDRLAKYTSEGGAVRLERQRLETLLNQDLGAGVNVTTYSALSSEQFISRLAGVMESQYILEIGGNNLNRDEYLELVGQLITLSHTFFKQAVQQDENAFRQALLSETAGNSAKLQEVSELLTNKFGVALGMLSTMQKTVTEIDQKIELSNLKLDELNRLIVNWLAGQPNSFGLAFPQAQSIVETKRNSGDFDVFLCHNGQDKSAVKEIANKLIGLGIRPWLDEWELRPGIPWQRELEKQIAKIKSAAVFVGDHGVGPWQQEELEAFLREFNRRSCPVIPVILDYAPKEPDLPIFLSGRTWVNFRQKDPDPLKRLVWGITGLNESPANF